MATEISLLARFLRVRGLVPWVDKNGGFQVGDHSSSEARRAILNDCSGLILYTTRGTFESRFITEVELPAALEAKQRDPSFVLFAVPRRIGFAELARRSEAAFGADLAAYHGIAVPRGDPTTSLKKVAKEVLMRAVAGYGPSWPGRVSIQFSTRDLLPDENDDLLRIDARELFASDPAQPAMWSEVSEGLVDVKQVIADLMARPRVYVHGSKHLTAAFLFGRVFAPFELDIRQTSSEIWSSDGEISDAGLQSTADRGDLASDSLFVEIATATKETRHGVDALLQNWSQPSPHRLRIGPVNRATAMEAASCRGAVEQIYAAIEGLSRTVPINEIHLFAAAPQAFMMMLGKRFKGAPAIQIYEWCSGAYRPSFRVGPGVVA